MLLYAVLYAVEEAMRDKVASDITGRILFYCASEMDSYSPKLLKYSPLTIYNTQQESEINILPTLSRASQLWFAMYIYREKHAQTIS